MISKLNQYTPVLPILLSTQTLIKPFRVAGMRLRLSGTKVHEESHPKRHGRQPRTVPVPRLFADSRPGHAGQPERAPHAVVGSSGTDGHPPPGPRAGRFPLLLWHGLQQECDGGVRRTGKCRSGLRLLALWTGGFHGKYRPARGASGLSYFRARFEST